MKKILIAGRDSYIGTSFERYIGNFEGYEVNTVCTTDDEWRKCSFSGYDVVFHVAGLAHAEAKKSMESMYYKVNRDFAVSVCKKAKADGVKHFIFMSSIIVYNNKCSHITKDTLPDPSNFYGNSKLQADEAIHKLADDNFKVVSMRPPMIYGVGTKGNYVRLAKLAKKMPVFPAFENERSMIYITNFCECVRLVIDNETEGYVYPQNSEYINTAELAKQINPKIKLIKGFNWLVSAAMVIPTIRKAFGSFAYDKEMSDIFDNKYCIVDFETSVKETEGYK